MIHEVNDGGNVTQADRRNGLSIGKEHNEITMNGGLKRRGASTPKILEVPFFSCQPLPVQPNLQ